MKKVLLTSVILAFVTTIFAQNSVNNYKYVIIPKQYEFQKTADRYKINSLTKFLFERAGFRAFLSDEIVPSDLAKNPCLGLKAKLVNKPSLLSTKMKIELLNCKNEAVFTTKLAKTKEKEYKKAYHKVIRKAFEDIESLNYKYNGQGIVVKNKNTKKLLRVDGEPVKENEKIYNASNRIYDKKQDNKLVHENSGYLTRTNKKPIIKDEKIHISSIKAIEGSYQFTNWGLSKIIKNGNTYKIIGGTENFNFATLYPTSKINLYIIKYVAFKEPRLVELLPNGNLKIDGKPKAIKRVN